MNYQYDDSFTPWQTPTYQNQTINYLKRPQEIKLNKSMDREYFHKEVTHYGSVTATTTPMKGLYQQNGSNNYFMDRNYLTNKKAYWTHMCKDQLKKSHQSLHFERISHNRSVGQLNHQQISSQYSPKKQNLHTMTNFAINRKSLKERIQNTKKLLEQNENIKIASQFRVKSRESKELEESLQKLLSLSKSSSHLHLTHHSANSGKSNSMVMLKGHHNPSQSFALNSSSIDCFFQPRDSLLTAGNRQKNLSPQHNPNFLSKESEQVSQIQKALQKSYHKNRKFLQSKTNLVYMKKRATNKTLYSNFGAGNHSRKFEKSMNLPKIQILDWEKPQL